MHQYINLCPPYSPGLLHPICIVSWSLKCPYVSLCACPSCLMSVPTPCLECVYASVHVFMSTWLAISGPTPMHSFIETWVPLCVTVCVSKSPCLWCHNLFRVCTCISSWINVHLTAHVWSSCYCIVWWKICVPLYGSVFVPGHPYFCSHTLFRMCTCISTCIYVYLTPHFGQPLMDSYMESWVPLCVTLPVSHSPWLWSHTLFRMCTCISTWIYVHLAAYIWSTPYA